MKTSEQIAELAKALSVAQGKFKNPEKNKKNPFFKKPDGSPSMYADLDAYIDAAKPALAEVGLSVSQGVGDVNLTTMLIHSSGQWLMTETPLITQDNKIQSFVSATTYIRRVAYAAIIGLAPSDDDDGNTANGNELHKQTNNTQSFKTKEPHKLDGRVPTSTPGKPTTPNPPVANKAPIGMARSAELKTKIKAKSETWTNERIDTFIGEETGKQAHELTEAEAMKIMKWCEYNPYKEVIN